MVDFLAIADVQPERVQEVIRRMIRSGLDTDELEDFLSTLDWSEPNSEHSPMGITLLNLMNWTTMFSEGELNAEQYAHKLSRLLPAGGKLVFTLVALYQPVGPVLLGRSSPLPQTGSESEAGPGIPEWKTDNAPDLVPTS